MPAPSRSPRGFTLLELMIVVGISSITILTAVAVFAAMLNQKRTSERTLEVYTSLAMAQGVMEYDITNAGWRFPSGAAAVRVINNVDSSVALYENGLSGTTVTVSTNCGGLSTYGIVPGSDVLELAEGYEAESNGVVQSAIGTSSFILKGGTAPLTTVSGQPIILIANPQGDVWLGQVTSGAATAGNSVTYTLLRTDYGSPAFPNPYVGSPQTGNTVYRLGHRTRYVLCHDTGSTTARPILFRQQSNDDGNLLVPNGWQRLQDGVADFQVAVRVADPTTTHIVGGTECTAVGAGQYCYCNLAAACTGTDNAGSGALANTPTGGFFQRAVLDHTDRGSADQWVKGLRVGLTGVSTRRVATQGQASASIYLRPALFDHAAATGTGDGNLYLTQQRSLVLRNLTQVIP